MYYTGYDGSRWQTGVAFSDDGIRWTKSPGNPVLRTGPGWDAIVAAPREVIEDQPGMAQRFTMYYNGFDGAVYRTGIAYSDDGVMWTKAGNNPVLDAGAPGTWDQKGASVNTLIVDRGVYYYVLPGDEAFPYGGCDIDGRRDLDEISPQPHPSATPRRSFAGIRVNAS